MEETIETIKQAISQHYEQEKQKSQALGNQVGFQALCEAQAIIGSIQTKSELFNTLLTNGEELLKHMQQPERIGEILKTHYTPEDLQTYQIYVDSMPIGTLPKDSSCMLFNTTSQLRQGTFKQNVEATFVGSWLVDCYQASVTALKGALINLRDTRAVGGYIAKDASAIRLPDIYYQEINLIGPEKGFRVWEERLLQQSPWGLLDDLVSQTELPEKPALSHLSATATLVKGDDVLAENNRHTLVRNSWNQTYVLYQKFSEREVIEQIQATKDYLYMSDDLRPLQSALIRNHFSALPGERMTIGQNHLEEPITLSFNSDTQRFIPHNLIYKTNRGTFKKMEKTFVMDTNMTMQKNIEYIKNSLKYSNILFDKTEINQGLKR